MFFSFGRNSDWLTGSLLNVLITAKISCSEWLKVCRFLTVLEQWPPSYTKYSPPRLNQLTNFNLNRANWYFLTVYESKLTFLSLLGYKHHASLSSHNISTNNFSLDSKHQSSTTALSEFAELLSHHTNNFTPGFKTLINKNKFVFIIQKTYVVTILACLCLVNVRAENIHSL